MFIYCIGASSSFWFLDKHETSVVNGSCTVMFDPFSKMASKIKIKLFFFMSLKFGTYIKIKKIKQIGLPQKASLQNPDTLLKSPNPTWDREV